MESRLKYCGSYHVGHTVHHIQARLSGEEPGQAGHAALAGDGWIVVTVDGVESRWWTHDEAHAQALITETDGAVVLRPRSVLAFEHDGGAWLISVAKEPSPCPDPDADVSQLSLVDQIAKRGGFLVSGQSLLDDDRA